VLVADGILGIAAYWRGAAVWSLTTSWVVVMTFVKRRSAARQRDG
jgi:hypothetical protein